MTRFERELSGMLGAFWKQNAENELTRVKADLDAGKITVDNQGVARNCIGRVLMDDMLEKVAMVTDRVNVEATKQARSFEVSKTIENYKRNVRMTAENHCEMQNAFGKGTVVVDVIAGKRVRI